jgi:glycopeptide antibiotics resistance protein
MAAGHLRVLLDVSSVLLFALIWLGIVAFPRLRQKQPLVYWLFFTLFSVYLYKVLDYTLFQFQSLLLFRYFTPGLRLNGIAPGKSLNLLPLITLTPEDARTSLLNILLMVPFGFGLPFITSLRMKSIVGIGALCSIGIESLQLLTGRLAGMTFRIADINDVIFNTIGVTFGYVLFIGFMRLFRQVSRRRELAAHPLLRYIAERPQLDNRSGTTERS